MKQKCTGIIIDDEIDLRETLSDSLEMRGFNIVGMGSNGYDADQLFKEKQPDFVILDMNMPDYDGKYAIKKIKEQDPQAKIFVMTGFTKYSFEEDEVEFIFQKPLDLKKLQNIICESACS